MKNTKKHLSTGIAWAMILFTAVNISSQNVRFPTKKEQAELSKRMEQAKPKSISQQKFEELQEMAKKEDRKAF